MATTKTVVRNERSSEDEDPSQALSDDEYEGSQDAITEVISEEVSEANSQDDAEYEKIKAASKIDTKVRN